MTNHTTSTLPVRRRPVGADNSSQAAGHREADALNAPTVGDVSVREFLVAGGFRSLTVREMFA